MMQKRILIIVHTEYHLLLAVNQIMRLYNNTDEFDVEILIRAAGGKRLTQELDFSHLPVRLNYFIDEVSINRELTQSAKAAIDKLLASKPEIFIFFQEMDTLMAILVHEYSKNGTQTYLYQDGLKPYVHLKYHSLGLIKHHIDEIRWLKKYGYKSVNLLSPLYSKKYAFRKGINRVFLTFPESYKNWNYLTIDKIETLPLHELKPALEKLFLWKSEILPVNEKVILYMSQPMHDDGEAETAMLSQLQIRFPENPIIIKLHPLTDPLLTEKYRSIPNVHVIQSQIPAELFIMNLKESVILSVNSTSMFLNNPENKFYYLYNIFVGQIYRLSRYVMKTNPAPHVKMVNSLDEIAF